jgi:putative exosortase-associated protein (TIGR04073 family)
MRFLFVLLVCFCTAGALHAETAAEQELYHTESVVQDMSAKLCRGVFNVLTGWMEVPRQLIVSGKERGWWAVLPVGIPAGAIMTVARTGTGAFEIVTFYVPFYDSYGPIMDPAFVWQRSSKSK